ncbi:MAG: DUF1566 domain-containing protein [Nitrospinota bacterium]|nr:DUF1566 domain-containing protein [Nitrospinota bacterium]
MAKSILYPSKTVDLISAFLITLFLLLGILSSSVYAIPVESGDNRYLDNDDGTITDTKTGLMWMKKDSYLHSGHWLNWHEVHDYVRQLNDEGFAQHSDWQLPTREELKTLYESEKINSSQVGSEMKIHTDPIFEKNGTGSLWSGEANGRYNAFGVVFNTGAVFNSNKKSRSRKATRAVRININ